MASITIRNLELRFKRELRLRAEERGWSLEEEARDILREALKKRPTGRRAAGARAMAGHSDGFVLDAPPSDAPFAPGRPSPAEPFAPQRPSPPEPFAPR